MDTPDRSHRRAVWLIVGLLLALPAIFAAWRWRESVARERCVRELQTKRAIRHICSNTVAWSCDWPFFNVEQPNEIWIFEGRFDGDDVRRLRHAFLGVPIYKTDPDGIPDAPLGELIPDE
jgi:hypothetical protein